MHQIIAYFQGFKVLQDNPREYWIVQAINFLETAAYFCIMFIAVVFLSDDIGWSDADAGYLVTALALAIAILLPITGFLVDRLGLRKAAILAMVVNTISRLGIFACGLLEDLPGRGYLIVLFFMLSSLGIALIVPLYQVANRQLSSERSRGASFSFWFLVTNVGMIASGFLLDFIRLTMSLGNSYLLGISALLTALAMILGLLFIRHTGQFKTEKNIDDEAVIEFNNLTPWQRFICVISNSAFKRFILLLVSVLGVRSLYLYTSFIFPKYWLRVIGPDVEMGFLQAINPALVVIGIILFIPFANRMKVFNALLLGSFISSFSLLVLTLPYQWFGDDVASGYFRMTVLMLIIFSVGEIVWSPKLNEYIAAIAPKGQEGSYFGLGMIPFFISKLIIGGLSGHMLMRWSPEGIGEQIRAGSLGFWDRPEAMFLILFIWAIAGVLIAFIFRAWLTKGIQIDPIQNSELDDKNKLPNEDEEQIDIAK